MSFQMSGPVIYSLFDIDLYKFTMLRFILRYFPKLQVQWKFANRSHEKIQLAQEVNIEELLEHVEHVRSLCVSESEIDQLRADPLFTHIEETYFGFLRSYELPELVVEHDKRGGFNIESSGSWAETTFWETLVMSMVSELRSRQFLRDLGRREREHLWNEAERKLREKLSFVREGHEAVGCSYKTITDMCTRRRFMGCWHERVLEICMEEIPEYFLGTSNVRLALKKGIPMIGTMAHELFMALLSFRFDEEDNGSVARSQMEVLDKWQTLWDDRLSVMLTDTLGSDWLFSVMDDERISSWDAFRIDSGDPFERGHAHIEHIRRLGSDPQHKRLVWSDGLTAETIAKLCRTFNGRVGVGFGWGTDLGNEVLPKEVFPMASIVMKLNEVAGRPTSKLSDNTRKATGPLWLVEHLKRVCGETHYTAQPQY